MKDHARGRRLSSEIAYVSSVCLRMCYTKRGKGGCAEIAVIKGQGCEHRL